MVRSKRRRVRAAASDPEPANRRHVAGLLGLALVGVAVSLYLTYIHHRLRLEPGWQSACAFNAVVSCDAVLTSPYGSVAGTPVSAVAAWFYVVIAIAAAAAYRRRRKPSLQSAGTIVFIASSVATAVSLVLAALSVSIGALCPLCAVLYGVNTALLVVSWRAIRSGGHGVTDALAAERRSWRDRTLPATGALLLLLAIFFFSSRDTVVPAAQATVTASRLCEAIAQVEAGDGASPIELVTYTDFQCDRCRELNHALRTVRRDPRLRVVHRHCPVERECNPMMTRPGHAGACFQARAAICAGAAGRYDELADALFDGGPSEEAGLVELAGTLGFEPGSFAACLASADTRRTLDAEVAAAMADGVQGTPTLIVNGAKHPGRLTPADLACLSKLGAQD